MFLNLIKTTIAAIALFAIIFLFILPIDLPYSIKVPGKVLPIKEWVLSKSNNGQIVTQLINNKTGQSEDYFVTLIERGDVVQLKLKSNRDNFTVLKNDTIAVIHSNEINRQLIRLMGKLEETKTSLKLNLTGSKKSVIEAAKKKLDFEKEKLREQNKILARLKEMYEKNLISVEEYEIAQNESYLNDINIAIAKAQLETVQTGEKTGQIQFIISQINSLENEIGVLEKRLTNFVIVSPINGTVNQIANSDTILFVSDTSEYVILMPINIQEKEYLQKDISIVLQIPYNNKMIDAEFYWLDNRVQVFRGTQVIFLKAIVNKDKLNFIPGMYVQCTLNLGSVSIKERINKIFQRIFN